MNRQKPCHSDCMHRQSGVCQYEKGIQNSMFQRRNGPCIYYAPNLGANADNTGAVMMQKKYDAKE